MGTYCFDGSFEGFLCAVATCRERGDRTPDFMPDGSGNGQMLFGDSTIEVATVRETAVAFRQLFIDAVSREAFATARYAFQSRRPGSEGLVWRYLQLGLELGRRLEAMLTHEPICSVSRMARRVSHEAHKFKGFVRFREVPEGFLYAPIEPQADILPLIAPHFAERVGDTPWMIHDLGRGEAALFDLRGWRLVAGVELTGEPGMSPAEKEYAALWQRYFQHHAISERHNPGLQRKHVPLRVRKHLTEFDSSNQ